MHYEQLKKGRYKISVSEHDVDHSKGDPNLKFSWKIESQGSRI
jgi:hypothetical protein